MALAKVKTKSSSKSGPAKGRWDKRAIVKYAARKRRRAEDKRAARP